MQGKVVDSTMNTLLGSTVIDIVYKVLQHFQEPAMLHCYDEAATCCSDIQSFSEVWLVHHHKLGLALPAIRCTNSEHRCSCSTGY